MTKLKLNKATWSNRLNKELTAGITRDRRYRHAKITEMDANTIRMLLQQGYTQAMVAEAFGLSQPQVSRILANQQWAKTA